MRSGAKYLPRATITCEKSPNRPHIYLAPERGARGADPGDGWMVTSCLRGMSNPDPFPSLSPLELEVEQLDSRNVSLSILPQALAMAGTYLCGRRLALFATPREA